jgi:general secretion pathway protein A
METTELQDNVLQAAYLERLALNKRPFSLAPDPEFYFDSRTHSAALRSLRSFLVGSGGFALIYGDVGTGKTLVCRKFLEALDREAYNAGLIVNPAMDEKEFLSEALRALGGAPMASRSSREELFEALKSFVRTEGRKGKESILAVDEAQLLSDELFTLLASLSRPDPPGSGRLRVVLFANEELAIRLVDRRERYVRQRVAMTHYLQPLAPDEIGPYIAHRLAKAGSQGRIRFDKGAIESISRASRGYARIVNTVADHALLLLGEKSGGKVSRKMVEQVLAKEGRL